MKTRVIVLLCLIGSCLRSPGQNTFARPEEADEYFNGGDYLHAIPGYREALKNDPGDIAAKFKLGICYLFTRLNRAEAIPLLEDAGRQPDMDADIWFYLGKAYQLNNQLDKAIAAFERFGKLKPKFAAEAQRYVTQCRNAQKYMAKPANVSLQNPGKQVNSPDPDYNPFIDRDEMLLVFTSRRKENIGGKKIEVDGYRSSDIYVSTMENGHWQFARNVGKAVNTPLDEQVVGLSADGRQMYIYSDHIEQYGDLYVSSRVEGFREFSKPEPLPPPVNEKLEASGCMNEDGSILIFSRKETAAGQSDLYLSKRLPNGGWGVPVRLPDVINSPFNEDNPFISHDGKTLYFASEGHSSMGGFDLFRSRWDQKTNTFSPPENLGYPLNTTDDDRSICVTSDNRLAYISAFRPNGIGDLDIYRVRFNDKEEVTAIYTGRLYHGDTLAASQPKEYTTPVIATEKSTKSEYTFVPNRKTGRFVMALPAGEYEVTCRHTGFRPFAEPLIVTEMGKVNLERTFNIVLKREKKPAAPKG